MVIVWYDMAYLFLNHGFHEILHGIPVSFKIIQEMFIFLIPSYTFTKKPHICKKEKKKIQQNCKHYNIIVQYNLLLLTCQLSEGRFISLRSNLISYATHLINYNFTLIKCFVISDIVVLYREKGTPHICIDGA